MYRACSMYETGLHYIYLMQNVKEKNYCEEIDINRKVILIGIWHLAWNKDHWQILVNSVTDSFMSRNFLSSQANISFSWTETHYESYTCEHRFSQFIIPSSHYTETYGHSLL
jgi:hypothetical protein